MIDLNEISTLLTRRTAEIFPNCLSWTASDWFLELVGEVGEAGNIIKKLNRGDANPAELKQNLADELSDIFLCLLLNARFHNIDLETSTPIKFNQTSRNRGSSIRLKPKFPETNISSSDFDPKADMDLTKLKIYGLSISQIKALITFYRNRTGLDPIGNQLTPEEILAGV